MLNVKFLLFQLFFHFT